MQSKYLDDVSDALCGCNICHISSIFCCI